MRNFEVTFIFDPVLSNDEIKETAQTYVKNITEKGGNIVFVNEMGLRQLAYNIAKRSSGIYYCIEFQLEDPSYIAEMELALTRDERVLRYLTVQLDKFGVKYNDDKRKGLIGKRKKPSADAPPTADAQEAKADEVTSVE
jgi:small subunit ribosomal protein S6